MKTLDRNLPALVVDDSRVMCEIMCRILQQIGFSQTEFTTEGVDAILKLKSKTYGLLVTDLNMNPISGIDLIRAIWADKEIPPTPIVLTSANHHAVARTVADVGREFADVYILKPFTAEALDRKLKTVFGEDA